MASEPDKPETDFHAHLDACEQCREHPFSLCSIGRRLLEDAATPAATEGATTP